jgi:hypothetical protein
MDPEGLHDLGFSLRPVASGHDSEAVTITEEWGDQPSWNTGTDLGASFSNFPSSRAQEALSLLTKWNLCAPSVSDPSS